MKAGSQPDDGKPLALSGGREARVEANDLQGSAIVIRSNQGGRQLQAVCGAQRMYTQQAFGRTTYGIGRYDFMPACCKFARDSKGCGHLVDAQSFLALTPRER